MVMVNTILSSIVGCLAFASSGQARPQGTPPPPAPSGGPSRPNPVPSPFNFPIGANGANASVVFPLSNGFPNIANRTAAYQQLTTQARGSLSNAPPPSHLTPDDIRSFKVIMLQELYEVYYMTQLLLNITNNVPGFEIADAQLKAEITRNLIVIQAQEQWHALTAGALLTHLNSTPIAPCLFKSPAVDLTSAVQTASNITAVVLSTLQDVAVKLGSNGDAGLIRAVVAVVGQEGEQNGWYRTLLAGNAPSELPFLTQSTREFAYSALQQNFIVPGSCPNANTIDVPIFGKLSLLTTDVQPADQILRFSVPVAPADVKGLSLVYINQQNIPVVTTIDAPSSPDNGTSTVFSANFPFSVNSLNGLTIAAVTNSSGPFITANDVANATLFGPALIYPN